MDEFLASSFFRYALVPLGTALLGVGIKTVSKNDKYFSFSKEDCAVGLDLMLTACLLFVLLTTDRALQLIETNRQLNQALNGETMDPVAARELNAAAQLLSAALTASGWTMLVFFVAIWSVSTIVRRWGWKDAQEMNTTAGIAIPLGAGILSLIVVMAEASP